MPRKSFVLALITVSALALVGYAALRLPQGPSSSKKELAAIPAAVADAKAKKQSEVELSAPIPLYAEVFGLDSALANYTTVIARPIAYYTKVNADSSGVETWYKFRVEYLSQPKVERCNSCSSSATRIPSELQPVNQDEMVVRKDTGTVVVDGVKVKVKDPEFPDFDETQSYFLFVSLDLNTRFGVLDMGEKGVSIIPNDGQLVAVSGNKKLVTEINNRYGKIDKIETRLKFKRFPEP